MSVLRWVMRGAGVIVLVLGLVACGLHLAQSGQTPPAPRAEGALRLATVNVHYILLNQENGPWSVADWNGRRDAMDAAFKALDADVVAFQEMESFAGGNSDDVNLARSFLLERNAGYAAAAIGDWRQFPSTQPIFYRRDLLRVVDQGWFFFSDSPDVIYSRTFNGSYPAFASWAEFERRADGRRFHVFNVHFEFSSRSNRHLSAALVADRMAPVVARGGPVFLLGDLNDLTGSRTMAILQQAGVTFAPVRGATYHLNRGVNVLPAIDHIGAAGPARLVGGPVVLRQKFGGVWPTDHYPVQADYRID